MNIEQLYNFCLSKKGVTDSFPFNEDTLVFKVAGKMFCLTSLLDWELGTPKLNLKCDPEKSETLRATYEAVNPGFHMHKKYWNTVTLHSDLSDIEVTKLITHSYEEVVKKIT
ncbi:hypothetical protein NBRC110019_16630 [Neptunitalea chrysea]|uniref:MmcQ-like protein n=1 Tax=Neptunitalea chrysea TaxID=1647581 RepID=A0A9W6B4R1_9FLAO|nr:MmcQ/YjbR family DNA-binding protein [Neptunitalea chrysea]GLB52623.1 hypothetical protein NBRC110019_16630 [Neptunitalea chrysea]